jgi:hypothetical protein
MAWFSTGSEANKRLAEEEERKRKAKEEARKNRVYRHWMPPGSKQHVTFLDALKHPAGYDSPFVYWEHNLFLGGSWKNWFTCIEGLEEGVMCPMCEHGDTPYLAAAYTIVDHNEWTDSKGGNHKDELKLFVCKTAVQKTLANSAVKRKGLRGWRVEVFRNTDESYNTGDQFDWEERTKLPDDLQPYDYHIILAPKSRDELISILEGKSRGASPASSYAQDPVDANDDDIPF